jgi:hypothetical protein
MDLNLLATRKQITGNASAFRNIRVLERGEGWLGLACT